MLFFPLPFGNHSVPILPIPLGALMPAIHILKAVPELGLQEDDWIVVDPDEYHPVSLWRALPINFAATVALLVSQGHAIQIDDEHGVSPDYSPAYSSDALVPRSGQDRRRLHLKLEA